jgi:hypothetical protein
MVKTYFKFAAANGFLVLRRVGMVPAVDYSFKEASKPNIKSPKHSPSRESLPRYWIVFLESENKSVVFSRTDYGFLIKVFLLHFLR